MGSVQDVMGSLDKNVQGVSDGSEKLEEIANLLNENIRKLHI